MKYSFEFKLECVKLYQEKARDKNRVFLWWLSNFNQRKMFGNLILFAVAYLEGKKII